MKLLTKAIATKIPALYSTEETPSDEKIIHARFFAPWGAATWFAAEFDGEDLFFGYADLGDPEMAEWGYFSLNELKSVNGPFHLKIERDRHFKTKPFNKAIAEHNALFGR